MIMDIVVIPITLLVIAAASIAVNVLQFMERKYEMKEKNRVIAESARLEVDYEKLKEQLADAQQHASWAVGRVKDQQAFITSLRKTIKANSKGRFEKRDFDNEQSEQRVSK
jgi:SepF-like predicted cell division protein (DUF552 family)